MEKFTQEDFTKGLESINSIHVANVERAKLQFNQVTPEYKLYIEPLLQDVKSVFELMSARIEGVKQEYNEALTNSNKELAKAQQKIAELEKAIISYESDLNKDKENGK